VTNVLVAYASRRGSTAEIAEAIAEILRQSGLSVDCIDAGKVGGVESYDAVVLGSAVYLKRWRGDAKRFLRKHDKELCRRALWVFSSGSVADPNNEIDPSWLEPPKIIEQVERLGAREHVAQAWSVVRMSGSTGVATQLPSRSRACSDLVPGSAV
jgi:menaquinone-dependent protoporphyrinogen oxidase